MSKSKHSKLTVEQTSTSEMRGIHRANLMAHGVYNVHKEKTHKSKKEYNRREGKQVRFDD